MKRGRIAYQGAIHPVTQAADRRVRLADGRLLNDSEVSWLPPVVPGTIFALGLNYADHARELAFKPPEVPLIFLKGPNTLIGHRAQTRRPADATYMHYECELAVVIGKTGYRVAKADALDLVAGYTVANDSRSATTWRITTDRTCESRTATAARRSVRGWSTATTSPIPWRSSSRPGSTTA